MSKWITLDESLRGRARAVERERERIIKALEEDGERYYISQETFDYVVAIVKGESSE
jgi:hypothetical protein